MKVLCRLSFQSNKFLHIFLLEEIIASIYWLVADSYIRNITKRFSPARNKNIWRFHQIAIDMTCYCNLIIVENATLFRAEIIFAETYNYAMNVRFYRSLTIPSESAMSEINA